jgi:hypothetical protein
MVSKLCHSLVFIRAETIKLTVIIVFPVVDYFLDGLDLFAQFAVLSVHFSPEFGILRIDILS